ncbi:MAG: hypothetical protein ACKPCI_09075, partial [Dolichospermum sp.]
MPEYYKFNTLEMQLDRLKDEFIPEISPTGLYSESQLSRTAAYRVLAHAEIESYLEERAWEVVQNAKTLWTKGKTTRSLICLLGFSGLTMDKPPDTLTPQKGSKTVKEEKIKISKKIDLAVESFKRVISQNHGV